MFGHRITPHGITKRHGWLLPDALLALSIVTLTVVMSQQALVMVHRVARHDAIRLERARAHRDWALRQEVEG